MAQRGLDLLEAEASGIRLLDDAGIGGFLLPGLICGATTLPPLGQSSSLPSFLPRTAPGATSMNMIVCPTSAARKSLT